MALWDTAVSIVHRAAEEKITLRLLGGCGVMWHCVSSRSYLLQHRTPVKDIDLAGYARNANTIASFFSTIGYSENVRLRFTKGFERRQFASPSGDHCVDVYLDYLRASHKISWLGRLEQSIPTIPLADQLLAKLQVHDLDLFDQHAVDAWCILAEHDFGKGAPEKIDLLRIITLCCHDWALWRDVSANLEFLAGGFGDRFADLNKPAVKERIGVLKDALDTSRKTMRWRLRSIVGDRLQWYEIVES